MRVAVAASGSQIGRDTRAATGRNKTQWSRGQESVPVWLQQDKDMGRNQCLGRQRRRKLMQIPDTGKGRKQKA